MELTEKINMEHITRGAQLNAFVCGLNNYVIEPIPYVSITSQKNEVLKLP